MKQFIDTWIMLLSGNNTVGLALEFGMVFITVFGIMFIACSLAVLINIILDIEVWYLTRRKRKWHN